MHSYSVKKYKIKEYYGTQRPSFAGGPGAGSNFYSGRDLGTHSRGSLGTRGADSNFSRRMQALVPNDNYDLLEEEEDEVIDEDVVVENSRYSLVSTLQMNESILGDLADLGYEIGADAAAAGTSELTAGVSSCLFILKNIYEINRGRNKADEIILNYFIPNPNDESIEKLSEILENLIDDIIDLFQRAIECSPDPAGEIVSFLGSLGAKIAQFLKITQSVANATGAAAVVMKSKAAKRLAFFTMVAPLLRFTLEILNADDAPEEILKNKSAILGTIQRIVLIGDIIEDYLVQKTVAVEMGIPEDQFVYRHRILKPGENIDNYDYENPRVAIPIEERMEEEREEYRDVVADMEREREYAEPNLEPVDDLEAPMDSPTSSPNVPPFYDSPLSRLFIKPRGADDPSLRDVYGDLQSRLFAESLEKRSLAYLIEEKDSELEEEDVNEISAGGVAGVAVPLGRNSDGSKTTRRQIQKQYDYFNKTYGMG